MKTTRASSAVLLILLLLENTAAFPSLRGEHISIDFYITGENAEKALSSLRAILEAFPEDQQLNLTRNVDKISPYLNASSIASSAFAVSTKNFFNVAKNESENLLLKLSQVPSDETTHISDEVRSQLTEYFAEMENFHVILCGVLDDVTEFTLDSVQTIRRTFTEYTDVHNNIIERRKAQVDDWCRNGYNEFLWQSAHEMFHCATGKLRITYDIYTITKMTTYHVLKMLEHRIQKLYNCFLFGNYPIRCRFVRNADADFERLYTRLDELQMYNEKHKRRIYKNRRGGGFIKCIPENFPDSQLPDSIKSCLYFSQSLSDSQSQMQQQISQLHE